MFRAYNLGSTEYDPFRGAGAPVFIVYRNANSYYSAQLARVQSNDIVSRFVITNDPVEASLLWLNQNSPILGSTEIQINLTPLLTGTGTGEIRFTDPDTTKQYTYTGIYGSPVTVTTNIQPSLNRFIAFDSNTRNFVLFDTVEKVVLGSFAYTQAEFEEALSVDANQNPIFLPLPAGKFYLHRTQAILRIQTYDTVRYVGNQPLKVFGKGALGVNYDVIGANVTPNVTIARNNGVNQGSLDTTF